MSNGKPTFEAGHDIERAECRTLATFAVPSAPGNEREAARRVSAAVHRLQLEPARLKRLETAVAEATMNAMEHGNAYRADTPVTVRVVASASDLRIQVTDRGHGLSTAPSADPPDLNALLKEGRTVRGWGLFLIRSLVDQVHMSVDDAHHTVELVLHLGPPGDAGAGL